MKSSSILLNLARGPIVNEWALADALNEGSFIEYLGILKGEERNIIK